MKLDKVNPALYVLIKEDTLRSLNMDSHNLEKCETSLHNAQLDLTTLTDTVNTVNSRQFKLEKSVKALQERNFELEHPPWYKRATFWAPTGFVVGVATAVIGAIALD